MSAAHEHGHVPTWDGISTTIKAWRERVQLYILGTRKDDRYLCGARVLGTLNPDSNGYANVRKQIDEEALCKADGAGALQVVDEIQKMLGPRSLQEAVRLTLRFVTQHDMKRKSGEGMRSYVTRFEGRYVEAGNALKEACGDVDPEKFLHPLVRGILLMESSCLEVVEQNSVLATSSKAGNSWLFDDLKEALQLQWSDDMIIKRDKTAKGRRAQANQLEAQAFELADLRDALDHIDAEPEAAWEESAVNYEQVDEEGEDYEEPPMDDDGEEYDEETAMAAASIVEQFGGDFDEAEAYAFGETSSAARTFQEARRLLSEVRGARGYFPVVGIAAMPTSTFDQDRGAGKTQGKGRGTYGRGKGKGKGAGRPAGGRGVYGRG